MPSITSAATATPPSATRPAQPRSPGYSYKRREVERGVLYRVVRDHVETFYQAVEDGFVSAALPRFVQLPALASMDVAEVLLTIRCRVLRLLARRGVIETADELELLPSDEAERDPVLAQLTAAAVCGQAPAGPERRQRTPLRLVHGKGPIITGPLCVADGGFSLHAATVADGDKVGRQGSLTQVCAPPAARPDERRRPT